MNIYIKLLTAIVLVGIGALAAHHFTATAYEGEMTAHLLADSRAQAQAEQAAREASVAADAKLAKATQKIPHTGQKVSEAVHDNPTSPDCVVPDAAADSLQDGIRSGEASATR
jgi:hypothetical protein